ncbi:hypothetical protein HELRODRAFT_169266 [Helobdella robusta]|uniref:Uncharacterized protein n=1 Tax=Helobdella robusta TaxID=6412 RepID=T1F1N8_HELRO|nr:hypothetical protein HELRODRAFT_169266 [Helobdella robusta]ESO08424.1 hypothetical protein HELRODRAFT_169266 [Helobdella robusta]
MWSSVNPISFFSTSQKHLATSRKAVKSAKTKKNSRSLGVSNGLKGPVADRNTFLTPKKPRLVSFRRFFCFSSFGLLFLARIEEPFQSHLLLPCLQSVEVEFEMVVEQVAEAVGFCFIRVRFVHPVPKAVSVVQKKSVVRTAISEEIEHKQYVPILYIFPGI